MSGFFSLRHCKKAFTFWILQHKGGLQHHIFLFLMENSILNKFGTVDVKITLLLINKKIRKIISDIRKKFIPLLCDLCVKKRLPSNPSSKPFRTVTIKAWHSTFLESNVGGGKLWKSFFLQIKGTADSLLILP